MNDQEILEVARELAEKSGISFDDLADTDIMRGAYLHNAEEAIKDRRMKTSPTGTVSQVFTCPRCQDKAYIGDNPCRECNPRGLPLEQVHPRVVVIEKGDTKPNLAPTPKKGEYLCTKCNTVHRQTSAVGKKHLGFKG